MKIAIRKANRQDFPAVIALFTEFAVFQKTPEKMHITLEQLIEFYKSIGTHIDDTEMTCVLTLDKK